MDDMEDELQIGLSADETLARFVGACNRGADRLFITESWFAPFRARLLAALPKDLSAALVEALRDAQYKRRPLETVVQFVEQQPMTWPEFEQWRVERAHEWHLEHARTGFFPWKDVEASENDEQLQRVHFSERDCEAPAMLHLEGGQRVALRNDARDCPGCGREPSDLKWVYFSSPDWTWRQLCGRAGWLVICEACHMQVDFFLDRMN